MNKKDIDEKLDKLSKNPIVITICVCIGFVIGELLYPILKNLFVEVFL